MKKIITIVVLFVALSLPALSQTTNANVQEESVDARGGTRQLFNARLKAEKDFLGAKANAKDVQWFNDSNGLLVYYTMNGYKGKSLYNKKGKFIYDIVTATEDFLPFAVKDQVKSVYYMDFKIASVNRVITGGNTYYIVNISDGKTLIKLRINNGEMETIGQHKLG
jgi:hypothetical protein